MNINIEQLNFNTLLRCALQEWPSKITLNLTLRNVGTVNERYSVNGLGDMEDEVSEKYLNAPDEVLMTNLHSAIFETIHALALFCKQVELKNIRGSEIKQRFERRLMSALNNDHLDWLPEDKLLINKYFSFNNQG